MPIQHAIWEVGSVPQRLKASNLAKEQILEDMIAADPRILSDEWMLIGRQEQTAASGILDLLALAPDGSLILIELKRNKTPRDVVAQALDYAVWVQTLKAEEIAAIYGRFAPGHNLSEDFKHHFGHPLNEESLNHNHQIIIVAASLDPSSERIVEYLSERDIPINVLCFQVFTCGEKQLLSRAWLLDPIHTQVNAASSTANQIEPWNGEFYASFGHGESRSWNEAVKYGFISAGGGNWYTKTLQILSPNDRVWVKAPGFGFVGVCRVVGPVQTAVEFQIKTENGNQPALNVLKEADYFRDEADNPDTCEHFVPVVWLQTLPLEKAVSEVGLFGNQNTVCQPTTPKWRHTVERLKKAFPGWDK